jgi:orotate phosphoribosyltransferase
LQKKEKLISLDLVLQFCNKQVITITDIMGGAMNQHELATRIAKTAVLHGDFTLRSGRKSTWYIDKYLFTTKPDILADLGNLFATKIPEGTTLLAGAELGGIPLVTTAAMSSNLPCIFIRNQKKEYGTAQQLEGLLSSDDRVVIVEDIATTGGQVLEAAQTIQSKGASVVSIIAVIDRCEGARENVEGAGFVFDSLFTTKDLGITQKQTQ